jgi:phosphoglycerol transferase MdoB-like AlkP superfamily enzyme
VLEGILPAVSVTGGSSLGFAVPLLVIAVLYLSVPALMALTIANTGRRWWLWLSIAIVVVVLLLLARPAMGSLGVYWLTF